ncbi:MAG: flagellar biosynthetic protein FliP [Methylocystis sp.]|nr:MAG: flagellar biosynthetic protein FliP [Methylocystis sp.]
MRLTLLLALLVIPTGAAGGEALNLGALLPAGSGSFSGRVVELLGALSILSIAPGLLVMATSFTRFVIAFSFLRVGLGLQSTPANLVLISLSLFMTFFVMAPSGEKAWREGLEPLLQNKIAEAEAFERVTGPFRAFMLAHVRDKDIRLFEELRGQGFSSSVESEPRIDILVPAFMISELRRGFEIGFLIVVPFLVIDIIVAVLTMSMGMMMLPPATLSLPAKVLFFVLIDGWHLLVGSLVRSFG